MKTQEQVETLNGQAYPSSYGYMYPQNSAIRPCVVFDGGNRFIKWIDPENQVKIIPSCVKEVSEYQWKRLRPDPETVLLEVDGKRYVVGKLAQDLVQVAEKGVRKSISDRVHTTAGQKFWNY